MNVPDHCQEYLPEDDPMLMISSERTRPLTGIPSRGRPDADDIKWPYQTIDRNTFQRTTWCWWYQMNVPDHWQEYLPDDDLMLMMSNERTTTSHWQEYLPEDDLMADADDIKWTYQTTDRSTFQRTTWCWWYQMNVPDHWQEYLPEDDLMLMISNERTRPLTGLPSRGRPDADDIKWTYQTIDRNTFQRTTLCWWYQMNVPDHWQEYLPEDDLMLMISNECTRPLIGVPSRGRPDGWCWWYQMNVPDHWQEYLPEDDLMADADDIKWTYQTTDRSTFQRTTWCWWYQMNVPDHWQEYLPEDDLMLMMSNERTRPLTGVPSRGRPDADDIKWTYQTIDRSTFQRTTWCWWYQMNIPDHWQEYLPEDDLMLMISNERTRPLTGLPSRGWPDADDIKWTYQTIDRSTCQRTTWCWWYQMNVPDHWQEYLPEDDLMLMISNERTRPLTGVPSRGRPDADDIRLQDGHIQQVFHVPSILIRHSATDRHHELL